VNAVICRRNRVILGKSALSLEVPEEGLEPSQPCGYWILNPARDSRNEQRRKEIRETQNAKVPVVVPSSSGVVSGPDFPPDLARVVGAWPALADAIKIAVLTLVDASTASERAAQNGKTES
jgi:hypothetical protein